MLMANRKPKESACPAIQHVVSGRLPGKSVVPGRLNGFGWKKFFYSETGLSNRDIKLCIPEPDGGVQVVSLTI